MLTIIQVQSPAEIDAVGGLLREFTAWAFALQEGSKEAPTFENLEEELATLPGIYVPPAGALLLAILDDQPAGCVALKGHDARTCELKRLYVRPNFRGYGVGTALVEALLEQARQAGYQRMVLDSHMMMKQAHALYKAFGFQEAQVPADFPEALKPYVVFMELALNSKP